MKYYIDFQYLDGVQRRRILGCELPEMFNTKHKLELISVSILGEDGRSYFAVSNEFNVDEAWFREEELQIPNWFPHQTHEFKIRNEILFPIYEHFLPLEECVNRAEFNYSSFKWLRDLSFKPKSKILDEIKQFIGCKESVGNWNEVGLHITKNTRFLTHFKDATDYVNKIILFNELLTQSNYMTLIESFPTQIKLNQNDYKLIKNTDIINKVITYKEIDEQHDEYIYVSIVDGVSCEYWYSLEKRVFRVKPMTKLHVELHGGLYDFNDYYLVCENGYNENSYGILKHHTIIVNKRDYDANKRSN